MKNMKIITAGIATLFLSGTLFLAGCSEYEPDSPTAQVDQTEMEDRDHAIPQSPMGDLRPETRTEPYRAGQREETYSILDSDDQALERELAARELAAKSLPELTARLDEVQTSLTELRPIAEIHDELDDFEDLQDYTNKVARKINESEARIQEYRQEISEEILEVEAKVAEFKSEHGRDM